MRRHRLSTAAGIVAVVMALQLAAPATASAAPPAARVSITCTRAVLLVTAFVPPQIRHAPYSLVISGPRWGIGTSLPWVDGPRVDVARFSRLRSDVPVGPYRVELRVGDDVATDTTTCGPPPPSRISPGRTP